MPRQRIERRIVIGLMGCGAVVTVAVLIGVVAADAPDPRLASIGRVDIVRRLEFTGTVVPKKRTSVAIGATGRVTRMFVQRGDKVVRGQMLLALDASKARRDVERKVIALARARARLDQQLEQGRSPVLERLDVEQAELDLAEAKDALNALSVRAPSDGIVMQASLSEGDFVAPGSSNSQIVIADSADAVVEAEADEFEAVLLTHGLRALIRTDAAPDLVYESRLTEAPVLRRARTSGIPALFTIVASPTRPMEAAYFGMSARVEVELSRVEAVNGVPLTAIVADDSGYRVIAVDSSGRRRMEPVTLGLSDEFMVQLLKGPPLGTRVMTGEESELRAALSELKTR